MQWDIAARKLTKIDTSYRDFRTFQECRSTLTETGEYRDWRLCFWLWLFSWNHETSDAMSSLHKGNNNKDRNIRIISLTLPFTTCAVPTIGLNLFALPTNGPTPYVLGRRFGWERNWFDRGGGEWWWSRMPNLNKQAYAWPNLGVQAYSLYVRACVQALTNTGRSCSQRISQLWPPSSGTTHHLRILLWRGWDPGCWVNIFPWQFSPLTPNPPWHTHTRIEIDWCCLYYWMRNSLLALLEALFALIPRERGRGGMGHCFFLPFTSLLPLDSAIDNIPKLLSLVWKVASFLHVFFFFPRFSKPVNFEFVDARDSSMTETRWIREPTPRLCEHHHFVAWFIHYSTMIHVTQARSISVTLVLTHLHMFWYTMYQNIISVTVNIYMYMNAYLYKCVRKPPHSLHNLLRWAHAHTHGVCTCLHTPTNTSWQTQVA